MNYFIGLPALFLVIVLLLLWLYLERLRRQFPEQVHGWLSREKLTQEDAAELIGNHLKKNNFDSRTLRRWLSGDGPNPVTLLRMQRLLNGTSYTQAEQTLDDGSKSYGILFESDEMSDNNINFFVQQSLERRRQKRQKAAKQQAKKHRSR